MKPHEERSLIRQEVIDMSDDGPITREQFDNFPMNSYERNYLLEFLDDECIIQLSKEYLKNVTAKNYPSTYEETIVTKLFPEIVNRFEQELDSDRR